MKYQVKAKLLTVLALCAMAASTQAALIFKIEEVGDDVVLTGSGTVNLDAFSNSGSALPEIAIRADSLFCSVGEITSSKIGMYSGTTITGPSTIGTGTSWNSATTSSGDLFGFSSYSVFVPFEYVSGTQLSGLSTYENQTIESLGLTADTYVWNWGTGETADSITLNIQAVPEPATLGLMVVAGGVVYLRRRSKLRDFS